MTDRRLINDVASPQTLHPSEPPIRKVTWIGVSVNVALAAFKLAAGVYGDSRAVIADGIEALLDVYTVLLVYAGSRFWSRPPDDSHPFGHGRMETLELIRYGSSWRFLDIQFWGIRSTDAGILRIFHELCCMQNSSPSYIRFLKKS